MEIGQTKLVLYWLGILVFLLLELKFAYRPSSVSKMKRWVANLPLSVVNGSLYHVVYFGAVTALMTKTESLEIGLLNSLSMPFWLRILFGVLVLDFSIYLWHLLTHVVPILWRFHRVHHSDMNMDVSTANRFHIGELLISGLLRLAVIYTFGIPIAAYWLFEILVNLSVQFHHSSIKINSAVERILVLLFVPPFLHRIHHSVKIKERDSNYGVLLSIWDRFLGTLTTKVDQEKIIIGIGSHRKFEKLGFWHLMLMPFTRRTS